VISKKGAASVTRRRFLQLGGTALTVTLAAGAAYAWQSNVLRVEMHSRSLWNLPKALRIGVLSDLHAPNYRVPQTQLVEEVNRAQCDLLVILGDSIDRPGNEPLVRGLFGAMDASLGKYAVLGNWEYRRGIDRNALRKHYEAADVQLLVNEEIIFTGADTALRMVGLDDYLEGEPDLDLLKGQEALPHLVLSHCPAMASSIAQRVKAGTLILSGHTHGGQIAPLGAVLYLPPGSGPFLRGWYRVRQSHLYVSTGIGNSGVPLRLGVQPILALLEIT